MDCIPWEVGGPAGRRARGTEDSGKLSQAAERQKLAELLGIGHEHHAPAI